MAKSEKAGHRERLRRRFLEGDAAAEPDATILELLLFEIIPIQDVKPRVDALLAEHGGTLSGVLTAAGEWPNKLRMARDVLLKLAGQIESRAPEPPKSDSDARPAAPQTSPAAPAAPQHDLSLFVHAEQSAPTGNGSRSHRRPAPGPRAAGSDGDLFCDPAEAPREPTRPARVSTPCDPVKPARVSAPGESTKPARVSAPSESTKPARSPARMSSKCLLRPAVELLPRMVGIQTSEEARAFLRKNLPYNAEESRSRYSSYLMRQVFEEGRPDAALIRLAQGLPGSQDLRDVCFYRFCKVETLMIDVVENLLIPHIGGGEVHRTAIRNYLLDQGISDGCSREYTAAVIEALAASRIAAVDAQTVQFAYRSISMAAFAFVLHSEFPAPGIYTIDSALENRLIRALLWNPDSLLTALYELRNRGIVSKVSEIDRFRQFTVSLSLEEVAEQMANGAVSASAGLR